MTGDWWGEPTGDMRRDDAGSLVFDGPVLDSAVTILGMPEVHLEVAPGAPLANWTARLEDVGPEGAVSLVAGGALNGTQYCSTTEPERLAPGRTYSLRGNSILPPGSSDPGIAFGWQSRTPNFP